MTPPNFERALQALTRRRPFTPFLVELVSGDRFAVEHPEALALRGHLAVYINAEGTPIIFDSESVSQLIGATEQ